VGVLKFAPHDEDYRIGHLHESPYPFDFGIEPETPYFGTRLLMFQFHVDAGDFGPATLTLYSDPANGPVRMGWLAPDFTYGNLDDLNDGVVTDAEGCAKIDLDLTTAGDYCAVVYCNRTEHPGGLAVNVGLYGPRPDLEPMTMTGWYAPIVPQPHDTAALFNCPLPDTLHGGQNLTWMNMSCRNDGTDDADIIGWLIGIDGVNDYAIRQFTTLVPEQTRSLRNLDRSGTPWSIRGGRHTLTMTMDYLEEVAESVERNNDSGRQYCWSPLTLTPDLATTFSGPDVLPRRTGGWDLCDGPETLYPNCDGLRLAYVPPVGGNGWWRAVAVMPLAMGGDVDLELHPALTGSQDGFGPSPLASSIWGDGQIDFVLVHDRYTAQPDVDVGVLDDVDAHQSGYHVQDARSNWCGSLKELRGTYTMAAGRMIGLHEYQLSAGTWLITLTDEGTSVDWGMSLYNAGGHFQSKSDAVTDGIAWQEGEGGAERMLVTVPARSYYCLAVWKTDVDQLPKNGSYSLWLAYGVTGVDEPEVALPTASRIVGAAPNPFNPRTTIAYELAAAGPCELAIFDLQGRHVRTLVDAERSAGPGETVWDGLDDAGRGVAGGVYLARLRADGIQDLIKVTLVK
jgi:hypothetical protein